MRSASAQSQRKGTIAPCSWTPEESPVESCEYQDNANIHCQPFPESVSEEHEIYTDYDGCHRHHVKHDSYLSAHFNRHRWGSCDSLFMLTSVETTKLLCERHVGQCLGNGLPKCGC